MGYTSININYSDGTLCEEISFTEPGEQSYTKGSTITLSDARLSRDREMIVMNVNFNEDSEGGLTTTVSGFSTEYKYTRKSPNCDISFFTMTEEESDTYLLENINRDSKVYIKIGDIYGVGGWSMHSIIEKIVTDWIGLEIVNNLPNFWISDFTISIGSTFYEAFTGLISEFEPIIVLDYGTLYILERNGAGALNSGQIILSGSPNRSADREYTPVPGCIKVEGGEGRYIAEKDPTATWIIYGGGLTSSKEYRGTVIAPDDSMETYSILETYLDLSAHDKVLVYRKQTSMLTDVTGHSSYIELISDYVYESNILKESVEICKAKIHSYQPPATYNKVSIVYEHNSKLELIGQVTSRYELFIYNSDDSTYVKYDPRDYDISDLASYESSILIASEIRTTRYAHIDYETYGVDTVVASKAYNDEEEEWQTLYTFEHDIVEAGDQQRSSRGSSGSPRTLQVYAGNCPETPVLSITDEPARIFNIPTSDWNDIEDCYVYLSALVAYEFQRVGVNTPLVDPLPLMSIGGLGSIIQFGIVGNNYIKGYTINIDANSGHSTDLELEARRA